MPDPRASPDVPRARATMPDVTGRNITLGASADADATDDVEISAGELDDALSGEVDDKRARAQAWPDGGPQVAGVALVAADTGRVLMLQRALDDDDEASGTWEFPGGHLEPGDHTDLHGAMREWSEEIGQQVPANAAHAHRWDNGLYRGHVLVIPAENALDLSADRVVDNPDDDSEQAAWWDPADARRNPALRKECRRSPWDKIAKAAAEHREGKAMPPPGGDMFDVLLARAAERKELKPGSSAPPASGRPEGPAWASRGSSAPASVAQDGKGKGGKKRKVASKAGEKRYGLPIGTELGQARDRRAAAAQADKGGQAAYEKLRQTDPAKYREVLDKMSPAELEKLRGVLYSARSSDPAIVRARVAVTGAIKRKGAAPAKGGGISRAAAPRKGSAGSTIRGNAVDVDKIDESTRKRLIAEGWKGRPGDGAERLYRPGTKGADHMGTETKSEAQQRQEAADLLGVDVADLDTALAEIKSGNPFAKRKGDDEDDEDGGKPKGNPFAKRDDEDGDEPEDDEGGDGDEPDDPDDEDDEDDDKPKGKRGNLAPPFGKGGTEGKSATTTSKSGKAKASTTTDEDGDGGAYPIRTVGDVASALKKAQKIKDPERKKEVMSHIRKGAGKINAGHMVPKSDDADKGTGKGKGKGKGSGDGPPEFIRKKISGKSLDAEFADVALTAAAIEAKVMSASPGATKLREYWAHGEGRAKWQPGTPGDFERLKKQVKKYVPKHMLNGFVANVHKLATGEWPGKNAHGGKSLHDADAEVSVITEAELKDAVGGAADGGGDGGPDGGDSGGMGGDAVTLALDSYSDMADGITSSEEYEQALADQVQWELEPDASLSASDFEPERGPGAPTRESDDEDYDPAAFLDELAAAD